MSVAGWQNFAKFLLADIIVKRCRAEYYYKNMNADIQAPFLVIANHTTVYDPFLLSIGLKEAIYYVTSDLYFRSPILGFLAKKAGCIPKAKFISEIQIIKALIKCRDNNESIGIYPEGYRIWDGQTDHISPSIAKLIKLLKIPVVAVINKGGYLSMPRWAKFNRKGKMELHYSLILTRDEIADFSTQQIYEIITNALQHNDTAWQRNKSIVYLGKRPAESLELMLYCCPECHCFETMISHDDKFQCENCGYEVTYDEYGFFRSKKQIYFDNACDWRKFCIQQLEKRLQLDDENIFSKREIVLLRERKKGYSFKVYARGEMTFYRDSFVFYGDNNKIVFSFSEIKGLNVSKKNMIDFYYNGVKYRIDMQNETSSALFWEDGYKILSRKKAEERV